MDIGVASEQMSRGLHQLWMGPGFLDARRQYTVLVEQHARAGERALEQCQALVKACVRKCIVDPPTSKQPLCDSFHETFDRLNGLVQNRLRKHVVHDDETIVKELSMLRSRQRSISVGCPPLAHTLPEYIRRAVLIGKPSWCPRKVVTGEECAFTRAKLTY